MQNNNISYFLQLLYTKLELQYNKFNEFMQMFLVYKEVQNNANDCVKRMSSLISKYEHLFTVLQQYSDIIDYKFDKIEENIDGKFEQMNETMNNALKQMDKTMKDNLNQYTEQTNESIDAKFEGIEQDINEYKEGINTSIGTINSDLVTINKSIDGIGGSIVTINESINEINSSLETINTTLDTKADTDHNHDNKYVLKTDIIDLIYPVGSIYMSMNKTDPNDLYSDTTWDRITDRFLWCCADGMEPGYRDGEYQVTLTVDNLPNHNHEFIGVEMTGEYQPNGMCSPFNSTLVGDQVKGVFKYNNSRLTYGVEKYDNITKDLPGLMFQATPEGTISKTGRGESFSIIPPYIAVYCWQRIA